MAQSQPVGIYGLWNIMLLDYVSKLPLACAKVAGEFTIPFSFDLEDFVGGAEKFVLDSEPKYAKADTTFAFKQFDKQLFQYLSGANVTSHVAEAAGAVTALVNAKGTLMSATIGIASVGLTALETHELKAGRYIVLATDATHVDVYATTDADFSGVFTSGTELAFVDDTYKITKTPLVIGTGVAVDVPSLGVSLTGGSGTIALVAGDTAFFDVRPANIGSETIIVGKQNTFLKRMGLVAVSQPKANGEVLTVYCPKVQTSGFDISLKEYSWAGTAPKLKILKSTAEDMVCQIDRTYRMVE